MKSKVPSRTAQNELNELIELSHTDMICGCVCVCVSPEGRRERVRLPLLVLSHVSFLFC